MKKLYQKPEFTVIKQSQANAKFFVASGFDGFFGEQSPTPTPSPTQIKGVTNSSASSYGGDESGFNF